MKEAFAATESFGRVHYVEAGEGSPLLLLHSNGCSAHEYAGVMEPLARSQRVIAWDMPGHGDSDPITAHTLIDGYADAVVELMDALGIARAHVLGASVGGLICAALGQRHAGRVASLMIVEAPLRSAEQWAAGWAAVERLFGRPQQRLEEVAPRFRSIDAAFLERWNLDREKAGAWTMIDVMWAMREFQAEEALGTLNSPALVVFGSEGPAHATSGTYYKVRPDLRQITMEDCGHFPMVDNPDGFVDMVISFTSQVV